MASSEKELKVYWPLEVPEMRPVLIKIITSEIDSRPPENLALIKNERP